MRRRAIKSFISETSDALVNNLRKTNHKLRDKVSQKARLHFSSRCACTRFLPEKLKDSFSTRCYPENDARNSTSRPREKISARARYTRTIHRVLRVRFCECLRACLRILVRGRFVNIRECALQLAFTQPCLHEFVTRNNPVPKRAPPSAQ